MVNESTYLIHHGIKGQKWGVRRYQNFDGSYTQAGLKRYNKALEEYNRQNERVKNAKASGNKTELTNAKVARKLAKNRLNKDYRHLKQDKMGDQGKELYAKGYTITGKNNVLNTIQKIGMFSASLGAQAKLSRSGLHNPLYDLIPRQGKMYVEKYSNVLLGAGAAATAAATVGQMLTARKDNKLRAYYSHTSNY